MGIRFVMAVRPSVRTCRITRPPLEGFNKKNYNFFLSKICGETLYFANSDKCNIYFHKDRHICKTSMRRILLRKINFCEGICRKFKEGVLCLNISLLKIVSFMR